MPKQEKPPAAQTSKKKRVKKLPRPPAHKLIDDPRPLIFTGLDGKKYQVTPKQRRFVEHFLTPMSGGEAVWRAGYKVTSMRSAYQIAHLNLTKVEIVAYLEFLLDKEGMSKATADAHLAYCMKQFENLPTKINSLNTYYRLQSLLIDHTELSFSKRAQEELDWMHEAMGEVKSKDVNKSTATHKKGS